MKNLVLLYNPLKCKDIKKLTKKYKNVEIRAVNSEVITELLGKQFEGAVAVLVEI